jgi:hypothetical protein
MTWVNARSVVPEVHTGTITFYSAAEDNDGSLRRPAIINPKSGFSLQKYGL